ncbi:hypothetical protein [Tenacibaculum dicentrarchi]|uniref:hypothetical protein n=1 Tax=Tenacibaculum dicentrarchi TaxID=669041 RepID=UPI003516AE90
MKISDFLMLAFLMFLSGCSDDGIHNNTPPIYEVKILNNLKNSLKNNFSKISVNLINKNKNIDFGVILNDETVKLSQKKAVFFNKDNAPFTIVFTPYFPNTSDIGKELDFTYEVYGDDILLFKKIVFIKSNYSNPNNKDKFILNIEKFNVDNQNYIKEIDKVHKTIEIEF